MDFELRPGESVDILASHEGEARAFRDVLGRFASGVAVVTSMCDGEPVGITCQSFASVSLDPPLVMFIPARSSRAWPRIEQSGIFCVNFLAEDQMAISERMATKGIDKFAGVAWRPAPSGSPILEQSIGYVDCSVWAVHPAGDHVVVLGQVHDLAETRDAEPLLYFEGAYRSLAPPER